MTITQSHIDWAKSYPFDVPDASYVYFGGQAKPVNGYTGARAQWTVASLGGTAQLGDLLTDNQRQDLEQPRTAVLACGSNASPTRLAQKYQEKIPDAVIPVVRCTLMDHAVVHAANLTVYGSVPATFARSAGTRVETFVTLLTAAQLQIMDQTETLGVSYDRLEVSASQVEPETDHLNTGRFHAYVSLHGALLFDGEPRSLATIRGERVPYEQADQETAQAHAQRSLDHTGHVDEFIRENLEDKALRKQRAKRLKYDFSQPW